MYLNIAVLFISECLQTLSYTGKLVSVIVTVPGKRDHLGNFFKIELLLQQGRVGFELQNALHI